MWFRPNQKFVGFIRGINCSVYSKDCQLVVKIEGVCLVRWNWSKEGFLEIDCLVYLRKRMV